MYLRWKRRTRAYTQMRWDWHVGAWRIETTQLTAVLVTNTRIEGKPRQRYVATLGSIDAVYLEHPSLVDQKRFTRESATRRIQFLRWARNRLHSMVTQGMVTPEQRDTFMTQLAEIVPPPTEDDLVAVGDDMREIWAYTPEQDAAMRAALMASFGLA